MTYTPDQDPNQGNNRNPYDHEPRSHFPDPNDPIQNLMNNIAPPPPKKKSKLPDKKILIMVAAGLALIIALIIVGYLALFNGETEESTTIDPSIAQPSVQPLESAQTNETPTEELNETENTSTDDPKLAELDNLKVEEIPYIDPQSILQADIPSDTALVKEEIDRLADQKQRLEEQEKLLNEQVSTMNDITEKKAEQIALLEKQISQLEAHKAGGSVEGDNQNQ